MKAVVDEDLCTGCGLCEDTCPEVFEMKDDIATVKVSKVPDDLIESCKEAYILLLHKDVDIYF